MMLIKHIPALQVLIPFFGALFSALTFNKFTSWLIATISIILSSCIAFAALHGFTEPLSYAFGDWRAPIGIEYRLDLVNQPIILYVNAVLLFFLVFGKQLINKTVTKYIDSKKHHMFYSLLLFAHAGYIGVLSTNDLFNIYVFIEISSLATYVLISKGKNPRALIGAFDYLTLGTIGATLILISVGFFLSITGSLNMEDISSILEAHKLDNQQIGELRIIIVAIAFFLSGAILKMAFFPLHFWMMRAYQGCAPFVLTYLAAISSILGVYMIMRFIHFVIDEELARIPISVLLRIIALVTIILCSYFALKAKNLKTIIIYSTSAQIGYIFLILSIWSAKALLFQLLILDSINKIGLFTLVAHIEHKTLNLGIASMKQINNSGWFKVAAAFIIIFSAGLPLNGMFITKVALFDLLIKQNFIIEFVTVLFASVLGVLYHLKFAKAIFFSKEENGSLEISTNLTGLFAIIAVHFLTLLYFDEITKIISYYSIL